MRRVKASAVEAHGILVFQSCLKIIQTGYRASVQAVEVWINGGSNPVSKDPLIETDAPSNAAPFENTDTRTPMHRLNSS